MRPYVYRGYLSGILLFLLAAVACTQTPAGGESTQDPGEDALLVNPTPTYTAIPVVATETQPSSRCKDLVGEFEIQVLVGPSDAVGLTPSAVGSIPFSTISGSEPYLIEGADQLDYSNVLIKDWGSYTVTFDAYVRASGECIPKEGAEELQVQMDMSGNQLVEVDAGGFQGAYPWSGENTLNLVFPLQDGASASGEGWVFILHLAE